MVVSRLVLASPTDEHAGRLSDEVELYQRTYNTLLRSSGETHLRVLEPAHRAMGSSLHPLADSDEPDLGAFIYAIRRMPDSVADRAQLVILGQEREVFAQERHLDRRVAGGRRPGAAAALVRRRRRHARRPDRERLGRGRPDPDAGGLPDRVEQAARAPARGRLAAGPRADRRGVRRGARRHGGGLGAPARGVGRALHAAPPADRGPADEHARADARRHAGGLRADDAALVAAGARVAGRAGPGRPAALLRQLEHAQPGEHRDRRGARARGGARASSWSRSCRRTTSCAPSSRPSARAAARARGRTSSTSWRASTSTRTARRAARRAGARRRSAACRTSAAPRRCACPRRSSRCRG